MNCLANAIPYLTLSEQPPHFQPSLGLVVLVVPRVDVTIELTDELTELLNGDVNDDDDEICRFIGIEDRDLSHEHSVKLPDAQASVTA